MIKSSQVVERRQFGRRKSNLCGWISIPGRPKMPCTVLDVSVAGALVKPAETSWLPYNFVLTIEATRFVSWCEVRHQREDAVGVRFLSAVEAAKLDLRGAHESRSISDKDAWSGSF